MAKIFSLYINELIKISRKISIYIILLIMIIGMFVTGGIMKFAQTMQENFSPMGMGEFMKEDMKIRLTDLKTQKTEIENQIKETGEDKSSLTMQLSDINNEISSLETAIDMDIYLYSEYYISKAINSLSIYKSELNNLNSLPENMLSTSQKDRKTLLSSLIPRMEKVIKDKDFNDYTAIINEEIKTNPDIPKNQIDIEIEKNNLRLKYNVTNEDNNGYFGGPILSLSKEEIINNIANVKQSLMTNLDYSALSGSPTPLSKEKRDELNDKIIVYLKQLDTSAINVGSYNIIGTILGFGSFLVSLLLLIIAGGTISSEMSTGSIKSLIISPTKRWKIYIAKLLSLLTLAVVFTLICYIIGVFVFGIFFGFKSVSPYIYVVSGKALDMNFYLFTFLKLFVGLVAALFYMVFALMLSTITRNTATSVGVSISILFGGSIAYAILSSLFSSEWIKFFPTANLDFTTKIFKFDPSIVAMPGVNTTLMFSAIYVIVVTGLMFYVGLDSFNRRDIK